MPGNETEALEKLPGKATTTSKIGTFENITRNASTIAMRISMVVVFALMFLGAADVFGRYFFNHPLLGAQEFSGVLLVVVVFFGLAYTQLTRGHILIEVISDHFSRRLKAQFGVAINSVLIVMFGLMAWQGIVTATDFINDHRRFVEFNVPQWPFQFIVPVGAVVMCLVLILEIIQYVSQLRKEG